MNHHEGKADDDAVRTVIRENVIKKRDRKRTLSCVKDVETELAVLAVLV